MEKQGFVGYEEELSGGICVITERKKHSTRECFVLLEVGEFRLWRIYARLPLSSKLDALGAAYANPIRADWRKSEAMKYIAKSRSICAREGARKPRYHHRTKKALHTECFVLW